MANTDDPHILGYSTSFDSPILQMLARQAEARSGEDDFSPDAIAAVVLSVAALEGFLNELAAAAKSSFDRKTVGGIDIAREQALLVVLERLGLVLTVAEDCGAKTLYKFDAAYEALTGRKPDTGHGSRQQLQALVALRNGLVHLKQTEYELKLNTDDPPPDGFAGTWLGMVQANHSSVKWLKPIEHLLRPGRSRWTLRVCSRAVATWACTVVEGAAHELTSCLPLSEFRKRIEEHSLGGTQIRAASQA